MKNIDKETGEKIQELQVLEQNLQNLMMQKQAFQFELNETGNAEEELKNSKEDAYKLVGNIMIKVKKEQLEKQIKEKKELIMLRVKSIEKQEDVLSQNVEKLRANIVGRIKQ